MTIRLDNITITRAGNGFIVKQYKSNPSAKREWTSFTKVFLEDNAVAEYVDQLLAAWEPEAREES